MATLSSTLAWKIPWTKDPGRLQSMGSLRVRHDLATSLSLFTFMHWRRKWQPTPVFRPGESHGRGSLVGCRLWGCTQSDTTEATQQQQQQRQHSLSYIITCKTIFAYGKILEIIEKNEEDSKKIQKPTSQVNPLLATMYYLTAIINSNNKTLAFSYIKNSLQD